MKLRKLHRFLATVVLLLFSFSCASDLDLDQVNDLKLEPVVVANLAYFNIEAKDFASSGSGETVLSKETTSDIFNDSFFRRRIKRVDILFELENTIDRNYELDLSFLDINGTIIHNTKLNVQPYTGIENKVDKAEVFEGSDLDELKRTTKIVFSLTMLPGTPLTSSSLGALKFRSGATAYIIVE